MTTTNEKHAFVIRGRCDVALDINMFRAFKFNFAYGRTKVCDVEVDDNFDMSYDEEVDQYIIVLNNLPFTLVNEKVALTGIIFDINQCISYFRFIVDSFECTEKTTTCTIEPMNGLWINPFWGIANDINEEEKKQYMPCEVLFDFYVRTNLDEEYLQCIKSLQFTDVKQPGEDYDFIIRDLIVKDLSDNNDGKLLTCYGRLWCNKTDKPVINMSFIHFHNHYLKLKGIWMEDAKGNPITDDQLSRKGFIYAERVKFGQATMPWIGEPSSLCLEIL